MSSKNFEETCSMYTETDNEEIMMDNERDKIIK